MHASSSFDPRHPLKSLTIPRDALRPPSADNPKLGVMLSLLAHAGLIVALAVGVSWHTEEPAGVTAELWSAVPEVAAPPADAPPPAEAKTQAPPPRPAEPPPPDAAEREAQIAIEKARQEQIEKERRDAQDQRARERRQREENERKAQEKQERDKAERERQDREKAEAREREKAQQAQQRADQANAAAREKARQDQLRRMNEQLGGSGAPGSTGTAARDAGPSANYAGRIVGRIRPNIQLPYEVGGNPTADVRLIVMPDGTITRSEIVKPSGVKEWDDALLRAIEKTAILPRDENGRVPSPMVLSVSRYPK